MTLNLTIPQQMHTDFSPRITVIGVGGAGTNAVDNMIALNLQGVEFVVANTDAQQLMHSRADRRIQLGPNITQGLGAGAKPIVGRAAAEEAADELYRHLEGAHMVFITAGMGGGTGTGAAPVIARMAREKNILTVGVVTKPFTFEGMKRMKAAEEGILDLQQYVDTLIVIPNQNLFRQANERTGFKEAFKMADNVLYMGVRGVTDLMMAPGLINLDFADIRTVMAEMGKAMMGTGEADGEGRAIRAAEAAISNPLLEDTSMSGARGLLINITGGDDMTLFEVDQAANRIREEVDEDANIIFGASTDDSLTGRIRVSVVATGIESAIQQPKEAPKLVVNAAPQFTPAVSTQSVGPNLTVVPGSNPAAGSTGLRQPPATPFIAPRPDVQRTTVEAQPGLGIVTPIVREAVEQSVETATAVINDAPPPSSTRPAGTTARAQEARPIVNPPNGRPQKPSDLFAEPTDSDAGQGGISLFKRATGLFRGRAAPPATPPRVAPQPQAEPAAQTATEETDPAAPRSSVEIPAFLRRQGQQPRRD